MFFSDIQNHVFSSGTDRIIFEDIYSMLDIFVKIVTGTNITPSMIMICFISDIPIEMFIIITVGIVIIIAVIIITIVIKCTCNDNRTPQEGYPHFDANSIPPNHGYTSSKAHQTSSLACTFKGGQQMNTDIWETPLPEPQEGEYTLPVSTKKQSGMADQAMSTMHNQVLIDSSGTVRATHHPCLEHTLNLHHPQKADDGRFQAHVTKPVHVGPTQKQDDPVVTASESEYTLPVKTNEPINSMPPSATSDYTIPVLPHPVPDTPDSESEYIAPKCLNAPDQKQNKSNGRSSLQRIL